MGSHSETRACCSSPGPLAHCQRVRHTCSIAQSPGAPTATLHSEVVDPACGHTASVGLAGQTYSAPPHETEDRITHLADDQVKQTLLPCLRNCSKT
jgi:hypothetical protein